MSPEQEPIYHITTKEEWEAALAEGVYLSTSLPGEGFIHCATATQVDGVLERYFRGKSGLVKLVINPVKLTSLCRFDNSPILNEAFPHVYGPLNLEAISGVIFI